MTIAKDVDEYVAIQRAAIDRNPECGNSHYNLAVGYMGKRMLEEAEAELYAALECSPSLAEAYVLLGGICMQRGDLEEALAQPTRDDAPPSVTVEPEHRAKPEPPAPDSP